MRLGAITATSSLCQSKAAHCRVTSRTFWSTMLVRNFAVVPVVVFALASTAGDQALLVGVLLVLLAPCIDTSSYSRGW